MHRLLRILKHRWLDTSDTRRWVPDDMAQRLEKRVAASEHLHAGELRLCVEAALPLSYLWRCDSDACVRPLSHERALSWFGRLGVWDTQHNNGVLIYLLVAEHTIHIVADRGLNERVEPAFWQTLVDQLGHQLHDGDVEGGLTQALETVSSLLVQHFPSSAGAPRANELPDAVVRV